MRIFKGAVKIAAFIGAIVLINFAIMFALEPYGSKSQVMWNDYRQQNSLEMVILGTSLSERAFDPAALQDNAQMSCYNMSTPGQRLEESYLGMVKAIDEHPLKTVVLGFDWQVEEELYPNPGRAFIRFKNQDDPMQNLPDIMWLLCDERNYASRESINWLFPWIENHIVKSSPKAVSENIRMKMDGTTIYQAAEKNEPGWTYYGNGYGNYTTTFDYNEGSQSLTIDSAEKGTLKEDKMELLAKMCDYCTSRGIDFVVAVPEVPSFILFGYGDTYFENTKAVADLLKEHGGEFYDMNMARPEILDTTRIDFFADNQHLNTLGGQHVSKAFAEVLKAKNAGMNVEDLFYTLDEYKQAKNYVDFVKLAVKVQQKGARLIATAYAGPSCEPLYRFKARKWGDTEWTVIRNWGEQKSYTYEPSEPGDYEFRVDVRAKGHKVEYERYRVVKANVN